MSRIGKTPITIPPKAKVTINADTREVTVQSGSLSLSMIYRPEVRVGWGESEQQLVVSLADASGNPDKFSRALWGTTRATIQNMVIGVTEGYKKELEIVGVGWGAQLKGQHLALKVGYANTIEVAVPEGVSVAVDKAAVTVTGPDKQAVGQFAAAVRSKRKPEPYNGKGIRYKGEVVRRKQGKAFGS